MRHFTLVLSSASGSTYPPAARLALGPRVPGRHREALGRRPAAAGASPEARSRSTASPGLGCPRACLGKAKAATSLFVAVAIPPAQVTAPSASAESGSGCAGAGPRVQKPAQLIGSSALHPSQAGAELVGPAPSGLLAGKLQTGAPRGQGEPKPQAAVVR